MYQVKIDRNNKIDLPKYTSAADSLKEMMDHFSINQTDFSTHIGISQKHLSEILRRKVFMSADVANRIEEATGMQAMMLLQLDAKYQLEKSRKKRQEQPLNKVVQRYDWAKA